MIGLDFFNAIGQAHLVNQDYSFGDLQPFPHIMVSDGCSSSPHTDVGARMLSLAIHHYFRSNTSNQTINETDMLSFALKKARSMIHSLDLPETSLDASLIIAYVKNQMLHISAYGDGVVFIDHRLLGELSFDIQYSHNTPYYPSYQLDKGRNEIYRQQAKNAIKTIQIDDKPARPVSLLEPVQWLLPVHLVNKVIIASDGINSFVDKTRHQTISYRKVLSELQNFPNSNGQFLTRRVRRTLKLLNKQDIHHQDDMAVAAIMMKETKP